MARLTPAHLAELRVLHDEAAATVDWLAGGGHIDTLGAQLRAVVADVVAVQDLRGMRTVAREVRAMSVALAPEDRVALAAHVAGVTGLSSTARDHADGAAVAAVLARGRIRNDREYDLLRDRLDVEAVGGAPSEEARAVAALLDAYRAPA